MASEQEVDDIILALNSPDNEGNNFLNYVKKAEALFNRFHYIRGFQKIVDEVFNKVLIYFENEYAQTLNYHNTQNEKIRQSALNMISMVSAHQIIKTHIDRLLKCLFTNIKFDCEENALISIRIIVDLIKSHRPPHQDQILEFIKSIPAFYDEIDKNTPGFRLFEINDNGYIVDDPERGSNPFSIQETFDTIRSSAQKYSGRSLKVLAEIHVFLVLAHQLYRQNISSEIDLLLPQTINLINLQPLINDRKLPDFDRDRHLDLLNLQLKALSLIIYVRRTVKNDGDAFTNRLVRGCVALLRYFPLSAQHLKKELLLYLRYVVPHDKTGFVISKHEMLVRSLTESGITISASDGLRTQIAAFLGDLVTHSTDPHGPQFNHLIATFLIEMIFENDLIGSSFRICAKARIAYSANYLESIQKKLLNLPENEGEEYTSLRASFESALSDGREIARVSFITAKTVIPLLCINSTIQQSKIYVLIQDPHLSLIELKLFCGLFRNGTRLLGFFREITNPELRTLKLPKLEIEKDLVEHFTSLFINLHNSSVLELFLEESQNFFQKAIESSCLQGMPNILLAHQQTSATFSFLFLEFFAKNLFEFSVEQSVHYFRILKMVLGSTMVFRENETIIKNYVSFILENSLQKMLCCGQTLNYLFLLRALFRSIGSSNNDSLYQEFLPQLRNILTAFNRYRTSLKYGVILEVLIELSLSVPVRLSNLVPHMPLIMEPLVTSLRTSSAVNSQGHRTLELCLDTLHLLFVDDLMDEVRNDILVELVKRAAQNSETSLYSVRLIGKMSSAAVKPYQPYQRLKPVKKYPQCTILFNHKMAPPFIFPFYKTLKTVVNLLGQVALALTSNSPQDSAKDTLVEYAKYAWIILKIYLRTILPPENLLNFIPEIKNLIPEQFDNSNYSIQKSSVKLAFLGLIHGLRIPDIRTDAIALTVYCSRVFIAFSLVPNNSFNLYMHPGSFLSAIFKLSSTMSNDAINLSRFLLNVIIHTTQTLAPCINFIDSPIYKQLKELNIKYCFKNHYDEKYACLIITKHICYFFSFNQLKSESEILLHTFFDIISGLYSEISSGTLELAAETIINVLKRWFLHDSHQPQQLDFVRKKVVIVLVKQIHALSEQARKTAKLGLEFLSQTWNIPMINLVNFACDFINNQFKKIASCTLQSLPVTVQLAELDALAFYSKLPTPFPVWTSEYSESIAASIFQYCESDLTFFQKNSSTKLLQNSDNLRLAAFSTLETLKNIPNMHLRVISSSCKAITNSDGIVLDAAKNVLLSFCGTKRDEHIRETVSTVIRPLLIKLAQFQQFTVTAAKQMRCLVEAFPDMFNEKLCDQFISTMKDSLNDFVTRLNKNEMNTRPLSYNINKELSLWTMIVDIFHLMPNATHRFIQPLMFLLNELRIHLGLRFYEPLFTNLLKFLNRYPFETIDYLVKNIKDKHLSDIFTIILRINTIKNGVREILIRNPFLFFTNILPNVDINSQNLNMEQLDFDLITFGFRIIWIVQKNHPNFLSIFPLILTTLRKLWRQLEGQFQQQILIHLISKCVFSHLMYSLDIPLLFEFIETASITFLSAWFLEFSKKFYDKLSEDQILEFCKEALIFFHNTTTTDLQRIGLLRFMSRLIKAKISYFNDSSNSEKLSNCFCEFFDSLIIQGQSSKYRLNIRASILELGCTFIEQFNGPLINNIFQSKILENLINYVQISVNNQQFDPHTRCLSFLLMSLVVKKYNLPEILIEQSFIGLLRAYNFEFKNIIKQAVSHIMSFVTNSKERVYLVGSLAKKILTEDGNIALAIHHILTIITEYSEIFYHSKNILYLPIISCLTRPYLWTHNMDDNPILIQAAHMLLDWGCKDSKPENSLSILFSYLLHHFVILNENSFYLLRQPELYVQKTMTFMKDAWDRQVLSDADINFDSFESLNLTPNSTISPNSGNGLTIRDKSAIQQFTTTICQSIDLLIFLSSSVNLRFMTILLGHFSDDIIKLLFGNTTQEEIKIKLVELFEIIFDRCSHITTIEPRSLQHLFRFPTTWIADSLSALENNQNERFDHYLSIQLLTKLYKTHPSLVDPFISNVVTILNRYSSSTLDPGNSDRQKTIGNLIQLASLVFPNASESTKFIFFDVFSNIARNLRLKNISLALLSFVNVILDHLNILQENYMVCLVNFLYQFVYTLALSHTFESDLHIPTFTKMLKLFSDDLNFQEDCLSQLNAIYNCGALNYFRKVRDMYTGRDKKLIPLSIFNKFISLLTPIQISPIHCCHSFIKQWLRVFLLTSSKSNVKFGNLSSALSTFSEVCKKSDSSSSIKHFDDWNKFFVDLSHDIFDAETDSFKPNFVDTVTKDFNIGFSDFQSIDNCEENFYENLINLLFFDGELAHNLWIELFCLFWPVLEESERLQLAQEFESFLIDKYSPCFNDLSFLRDLLSHAKENVVTMVNQNLSLLGFYHAFYANSIRPERVLPQRLTSLCRISCLPTNSLSSLFAALSTALPPISLFPSVVSYVAKTQFCDTQAVLYLEQRENFFEGNLEILQSNQPFDISRYRNPNTLHPLEVFIPLEALYSELHETDYRLGIWSINALFGTTLSGLGLLAHGFELKAADQFETAMTNFEHGSPSLPQRNDAFFRHECRVWQEGLMDCMKELGQWGRLFEFSKGALYDSSCLSSAVVSNVLTSSWKNLDLSGLKQMLSVIDAEPTLPLPEYEVRYHKTIATLFSKDSFLKSEPILENLNLGLQDISQKLSQLPEIITPAHLELFRVVHAYIELIEIQKLLSAHQSTALTESALPALVSDLKNIHKSWRVHYPEKFDRLSHWSEILGLRQLSIAWALGYLDSIKAHSSDYSLSKFVLEQFTQQCVDSGSQALLSQVINSQLFPGLLKFVNTSSSQDSFVPCLETIEAVSPILTSSQLLNYNFSFISQEVKLYLRLFKRYHDLSHLQRGIELVTIDMTSRQLSKENQGNLLILKGQLQAKLGLYEDANLSFSDGLQKIENSSGWAGWAQLLDRLFVESQSVGFGVSAITAYLSAARLSPLKKSTKYIASAFWLLERDSTGQLSSAFGSYSSNVNSSAFLKFLPHLFLRLIGTYGEHFSKLLAHLGQLFAQPIYSFARLYTSVVPSDPPTVDSSSPLLSTPARRLQHVIHAAQMAESVSTYFIENFVDALQVLSESPLEQLYRLTKLSLKITTNEASMSSTKECHPSQALTDKLNEIASNVHLVSSTDVLPSNPTVDQVFSFLSNIWSKVRDKVLKIPKKILLVSLSQFFYSLTYYDILLELPGEAFSHRIDVQGIASSKLVKFDPIATISVRPTFVKKNFTMLFVNGKRFSFNVDFSKNYHENLQETCVFDIFDFSNSVFRKSKDTSRRNIYLKTPYYFIYRPNLKLVQEDPKCISLLDILIQHLDKSSLNETSVLQFMISLNRAIKPDAEPVDLASFDETAAKLIPATLLTDWAHNTYPDPISYFAFRKQFTLGLAIFSAFEYVLNLLPLYPDFCLINPEFGSLHFTDINLDMFLIDPESLIGPDLNRKGLIRLTPNIQHFLMNIGIHGPFSHTMFAASCSISRSNVYWPTMFKLVLKQATLFWKDKNKKTFENHLALIEGFSKSCSRIFCGNFYYNQEFANPDTGLKEISQLIDVSMNPNNLLSHDILWIPLL